MFVAISLALEMVSDHQAGLAPPGGGMAVKEGAMGEGVGW